MKFSVVGGQNSEEVLQRTCPNASIVRFQSKEEALLALSSKRVDAVCVTWIDGAQALKKNSSLGTLLVPQPLFGSNSAIGFRREKDRSWLLFVNTWISYGQGMGEIREIIARNLPNFGVTMDNVPSGLSL